MDRLTTPVAAQVGSGLVARQIFAVIVFECQKVAHPRRSMPVFLLAALPIAVVGVVAAFVPTSGGVGAARGIFVGVFYNLLLGASVFFGCALIFTKLFRAEMLQRTLHFYLLAPIPREALFAGKYVAGVLTAWTLFGIATVVSYWVLFAPAAPGTALADWLPSLFVDLGVTLLACVAYGALFLLFGLWFQNPILPVAGLFAWEGLHFLLPPPLQALSVRYHLGALTSMPMPASEGPFAVLAIPPTPMVAFGSLLVLTVGALGLGVLRLRRLEIRYTED